MKIDAECEDKNGVKAVVSVDLDYVHGIDQLKSWIEEELYIYCISSCVNFDTTDFIVQNWNELLEEVESTV